MKFHGKRFVLPVVGLLGLGLLAQQGVSQDKPVAVPAGMDAGMAEMMKLGAPGPEHATLKRLAGNFTAEVTMKMGADAPAMNSKGTLKAEMIFGGRYIKSDYTGDFMGQPFHGMSLVGYDNMKKKFISMWIDDMSTMAMMSEGTADASGKVTYVGEAPCMMDGGKIKPYREVVTVTDDDHWSVEMFSKDASDKEFLGMSIKYTRVK
ncbi:MAG: DUF1579 domain-containing protein [Burkholderiales bacterium]|nr:DUF1579 domain-containing protein [Phycisphaerae bacterium]